MKNQDFFIKNDHKIVFYLIQENDMTNNRMNKTEIIMIN